MEGYTPSAEATKNKPPVLIERKTIHGGTPILTHQVGRVSKSGVGGSGTIHSCKPSQPPNYAMTWVTSIVDSGLSTTLGLSSPFWIHFRNQPQAFGHLAPLSLTPRVPFRTLNQTGHTAASRPGTNSASCLHRSLANEISAW